MCLKIITKNAKLQLPADVYAAEFLNYDPDAVVEAGSVVQKKVVNRPPVPDFVLPVKAIGSVYDTSGVCGDEIVSFGGSYNDSTSFPDLKLSFKANLIDSKEIDTRNLVSCQQLNLCRSPILSIDT